MFHLILPDLGRPQHKSRLKDDGEYKKEARQQVRYISGGGGMWLPTFGHCTNRCDHSIKNF